MCEHWAKIRASAKQDENSLVIPNKIVLASRVWTRIPTIQNPFLIVPIGAQAGRIYLAPGKDGVETSAATLAATAYSREWGAVGLVGGDWYYYYDAATTLDAVQLDCPNPVAMLMYLGLGLVVNGLPVSTANPLPVTGSVTIAAPTHLTMTGPETVGVGVASGLAKAILGTHRYLYVRNTSQLGEIISLSFQGAAAVLNSGLTLAPGDWYCFDEPTLIPGVGNMNAIASAATATLAMQLGT